MVDPSVALANQRSGEQVPLVTHGVASGDVDASGAILWARADRPSRMHVELAATESFRNPRKLRGPAALEVSDFTVKLRAGELPSGEEVFYRIRFEDLERPGRFGPRVSGRLKTASRQAEPIRFLWSGDTAGQGYGINSALGGMTTYRAMAQRNPDFFVHCGDTIYADNPIVESITLDQGRIWNNVTTPETSKVAETLAEFRANYRYNLIDEHVRAFQAATPMLAQWDDHETTNNWYPGEMLLDDERYTVKSASLLSERSRRAFFEYLPLRDTANGISRIHRRISRGPLLDLFFLDMRSFRGPNSRNQQTAPSRATALLGDHQVRWLQRQLSESQATWKIICSDMPLGLIVGDGAERFDNGANKNGPPKGRELELAGLLQTMKRLAVRNVVWLTADVHYAASHYYNPARAVFDEFDPFWEFVSGPLHAGTFGPNPLDDTFGPEVKFSSVPPSMQPNRPPSDGLQFFGQIEIAGDGELTATHFNSAGERLWATTLHPV